MTLFIEKLESSWKSQQSLLCVGLDPDISKLPASIKENDNPLLEFNRRIIDATADYVCSYKPQIAYYSAIGAESQLEQTIQYIKTHYPHLPVILDAKRGDIGATAKMYAIEAFERYDADAVTVNPYMGGDTLQPYLNYKDRGVIVLCRTSNPGSGDLQELESQGKSISHHVAHRAATQWNNNKNVALVVGATYPEEIGTIRGIVGDIPLLIPGIGAQGGDIEAVLKNGLTVTGSGLMINVSRAVINASDQSDFAEAAGTEARKLSETINSLRKAV